ncbi:MAG: hypothetical protein U0Q03_03365 [Acidimicrobiales bacterium]
MGTYELDSALDRGVEFGRAPYDQFDPSDTCGRDPFDGPEAPVDWAASCRLALAVSIVAAIAALVLAGLVGETPAIVTVIVGATAVSWFQLEQGQLSRRPAVVRHD